jgi:hypothetical protein
MTSALGQRARVAVVWLAVIAALATGIALGVAHRSSGGSTHALSVASSASNAKSSASSKGRAAVSKPKISVKGSSPTGLAPGVTKLVTITVTNNGAQKITLTGVTITAGNASASCTAKRNIVATSYSSKTKGAKKYSIKPKKHVTLNLALAMRDLSDSGSVAGGNFVSGNQDACIGARFPLTYHATFKQG